MSWLNPFKGKVASPLIEGQLLPEARAGPLSLLIFHWLGPLLRVGYSRPLEKEDLWVLPDQHLTHTLTGELEKNFYARCEPETRPIFMKSTIEKDELGGKKKKYDKSLPKALYRTFTFQWWLSGILQLIADTLKTTTPLVNKVILQWLSESYVYYRLPEETRSQVSTPRGIGYGIGLAFALFAMQETASLLTNHATNIEMKNGLFLRTSIIGNVFRKSLRLSQKARGEHNVGQITTMISTDASRFDRFAAFGHNLWIAPIQIIIGIGLLIGNLGYSALVGLGVLILAFPVQIVLVRIMFTQRRKGVSFTDKRVRLTSEILQGIRLLKAYAWEDFYADAVSQLRAKEIRTIRKAAIARAVLFAVVIFIPIGASVLSFITYALSGHDLNVAIIFSSLQFFNIIRAPLIMLPLVLSVFSDVLVALKRISTFLIAEELDEPYSYNPDSELAVDVEGDFTWETVVKLEGNKFSTKDHKDKKDHKVKGNGNGKANDKTSSTEEKVSRVSSTTEELEDEMEKVEEKEDEKPFSLENIKMKIPKGQFVGIVGPVGCGKSSILQALVGEMRRTRGHVSFGGRVAYVPQVPWIRNATLRENILFGQPNDEDRFQEVIKACSLEHDLDVLPQGEATEIGEKGINLSGGQKARVSLARAAFSDPDIVLLDDPLSAVDAYVGRTILDECLVNGPLAKKTRILVTHALHVLNKTDHIIFMNHGEVADEGTYEELLKRNEAFARLIAEHGTKETEEEEQEHDTKTADKALKDADKGAQKAPVAHLMQDEERNTGAVTWGTYVDYQKHAGGRVWIPILFLLLIATQAAQVGNNLLLGFWTSDSIPGFTQSKYMGLYAGLGVAQAVFQFLVTFVFAYVCLRASLTLFIEGLTHVLRSPVSFFDTTPLGRIQSRLSRDLDVMDNSLSMTMTQFLTQFMTVLGTVALVFYTFPYLGIIFAPLSVLYWLVSAYYRKTSVEAKRLDSLMRSALYSSFTETLTGLATIRAYGEQARAVRDAENGLDLENRAYYITVLIQRWLSVRLDLFGNILILGIALFAAGFRKTVDPSRIGVVLSYTLSITQTFSELVTVFAQNEQNMNAVERLLYYCEQAPEGAFTTPNDPPPSWPDKGSLKFSHVDLRYREKLPLVLKDVSFEIRPGEKVGIVGRTGAGKSSVLQALFRTVELENGQIEIDGVNIRNIGLSALRKQLALVPQDSTLFLGTLRENLDPLGTRTDAELIETLQRAWLLPANGVHDPVAEAKFSLDSTVGDEGSNFSAGEKQLLALARALVKGSRVIILDEATSSVDVETDAKLQRTIQTEFASSTLLCIAHRLNTIAYYDRILVMDGGRVAEFDTVLNLFEKEDSIFRSLCNEANLKREDILRIRESYKDATATTIKEQTE